MTPLRRDCRFYLDEFVGRIMKITTLSFIVLGLILLPVAVGGQNVTVNNNLAFGDVFPGIPKTVDKSGAGAAAEFYVSGTAGSEISIEFTLPKYMNSSGYNMQLIFTEADCSIDTSATPDQSAPTFDDLDPWDIMTYRLGSSGMTIWLGGTAVPALRQTEGSYAASIVITVTYTGN